MNKTDRVKLINQMFVDITSECEMSGGFNEVGQLMEELLLKCIPYINEKGHEIIFRAIENNSKTGVQRKNYHKDFENGKFILDKK